MTTLAELRKKYPIPKTVRRRIVMIDDKEYMQCPYPDCGYKVRNPWYAANDPDRHPHYFPGEQELDRHVKEVHKFVWMHAGKSAGWYPLSRFGPRRE